MTARRVVLVMVEPPLPFGNAAARWYYVLLRGLVHRGHQVTALAACSKPEQIAAAQELFPAGRFDLRCHPVTPRSNWRSKIETLQRPHSYLFSSRMRRDLDAVLARGFDVLHLEQLWSGWLGLDHRDQAMVNVHYSFGIDLAEQPSASPAERARRIRTQQAERRLLREYLFLSTVSPRLSAEVRRVSPRSKVFTLPFGLDPSLYPFPAEAPRTSAPTVGLIGSFNWAPSRSAGLRLLTRLWPAIYRQVPEARLQVVGRAARSAFGAYQFLPGVQIHEDVPDTRPYFQATDVFVYAPHSGSGVKVKILEAFALGAAVVTNTDGVEGIPALDGVHAGLGESDDELIHRTVALLKGRSQRERQRRAARLLVEQHCSPEATLPAVEGIYDWIAENRRQHLVA